MKTDEFITCLRKEYNIIITVHGQELKVKAPKEALTHDIIEEIKQRKPAILAFFKSVRTNSAMPTIERSVEKAHYQLSSVQQRLYFLQQFDIESLAYNVPQVFRLTGQLDKAKLERVFKKLVDRHESLRTWFEWTAGGAVQKIANDINFEIAYYQATEEEALVLISRFVRPFNLGVPPLIRIGLVDLGANVHLLMVDMHHIITDGVSVNILSNDFMALYNEEELPLLNLQYKDYAEWQQDGARSGEREQQQAFWLSRFAEALNTAVLPTDFQRPLVKSFAGSSIDYYLNTEETRLLKLIADDEEATLFMVLLAVFNILLSKLCAQEDIVVGIPVAGRNHADLEGIIGMFVNTLPIRTKVNDTLTFREFLREVKANTLASLDHQSYPYEELVDQLKLERETSRNPLFDVMFTYQNFEKTSLAIPGLVLEPWYKNQTIAKFDITLTAVESVDKVLLNMEYSTALFRPTTIERFVAYFKRIVSLIITHANDKISDIDIVAGYERQQLLYEFNNTSGAMPEGLTVIDCFRNQVQSTPHNTALQLNGTAVTYGKLDELSDRIAAYLQKEQGVKSGDLVGVLLERELYLVPCLLAIWKAGAAYVPIDPGYPAERARTVIAEAQLKWVITRGKLSSSIAHSPVLAETINLDDVLPEIETDKDVPLALTTGSHTLAYVIYTSGSTGKPKGVMITQGSLLNYISWAAQEYTNGEKAGFALYTSIAFDLTVTSLYVPLITGNTLFIYPEKEHSLLIEDVLMADEAAVVKLTPAHLKVIAESKTLQYHKNNRLKRFIVGGDQLETPLALAIHEKYQGTVEIYNEYGPTEATVGCMIHRFTPAEPQASVPIGLPARNTQIYILDKHLLPVGTGIQGELYIAGEGLAEGYYLRNDLTRERFINNPFVAGKKMYRTGDVALRLDDGNILYKGRMDDQVKIRGYRVELGEIESRLKILEGIDEVVVLVKEKEGDKYLVAWYVAAKEYDTAILHDWVTASLPVYMAPAFYVHLAALPLTINGKINKKALPDPAIKAGEGHVAPAGTVERELVEIWASVLNIAEENISVRKSFFELGGNSLKILKLHALINERMQREVTIPQLFRYPTIASLAASLQKERQDEKAYQHIIQEELAGMQDLLSSLG